MADHRFDYPTAAASTANIVFTRGAQLTGDIPGLRLNQDIDYSDGGTPRARNKGAAKQVFPLTVIVARSSGSEADVADLMDWIEDTAEGAVNTFQWTDADSVVHTVRIVNSEFTFPAFGYDSQSCLLQLEVE